MKKFITGVLSAVILTAALAGCAQNTAQTENTSKENTANGPIKEDIIKEDKLKEDRLKIVTTVFPEYDWVKNILDEKADNAELTLLLDNGSDLHSFQPTAEDILKIAECDIFIYVGGESDEWVEDALNNATNEDMRVIDLMEVLGENAKAEEVKEGMQPEEEEEEEEEANDEHVWLSLKNTKLFCNAIKDALCEADPDNAEAYKNNTYAYTEQLDTLDADLTELAENAKNKTLIFGDRFPFRYFLDDYGLDYYAAFAGCSAETEASVDTIVFLAQKADELGVKTIYTIDGSDQKVAKAVQSTAKNADINIAQLDSMQSVTGKQAEEGTSYLSIMQKNYEVLSENLS